MQNDLRNSYDLSSLLWIVAVLLAVLFSAPAIAGGNSVDSPQQSAIPDKITIKGTVVDKNSLPVAGATVVAKDRPALGGTVTDHKGHFTFAAPLGTILQISFVGYAPEEKQLMRKQNGLLRYKKITMSSMTLWSLDMAYRKRISYRRHFTGKRRRAGRFGYNQPQKCFGWQGIGHVSHLFQRCPGRNRLPDIDSSPRPVKLERQQPIGYGRWH